MLDTLPRAGGQLQAIQDSGAALAGAAPEPPDAAQVADAIARYRACQALREFRTRLYACLAARPDACMDLIDAILCADHAVTSLVQLSLVPEFRRGHGALYAALAAGRIDEEKLAALLTGTLPQLVDGEQGRAWAAEHDKTDYGLLERALAGFPRRRRRRSGTRAPAGGGCGSRSTPRLIPGRTPNARPAGSMSIMTRAAATGPARRFPAGSTSSPRRSGTCAPHGPP